MTSRANVCHNDLKFYCKECSKTSCPDFELISINLIGSVIFLAPLDMIVRLVVKLTFLSVSSYNQHVGYVKVNII